MWFAMSWDVVLELVSEPSAPKQLETHECVFSNVATGALVLKHQTISTHSADEIIFVLEQFHTEIFIVNNSRE